MGLHIAASQNCDENYSMLEFTYNRSLYYKLDKNFKVRKYMKASIKFQNVIWSSFQKEVYNIKLNLTTNSSRIYIDYIKVI